MEAVLATPGRDEGFIPSYSLLGELRDLCVPEPNLHTPIEALLAEFEQALDAAQRSPPG